MTRLRRFIAVAYPSRERVRVLLEAGALVVLGGMLASLVGMARSSPHEPSQQHHALATPAGVVPRDEQELITVTTALRDSSVLWIDARDAAAFASDHIPDALNCPAEAGEGGIDRVLQAASPERLVVVYCDSAACDASHLLAEQLRADLGSDRIRVLDGGWEAWLAERHHPSQPSTATPDPAATIR